MQTQVTTPVELTGMTRHIQTQHSAITPPATMLRRVPSVELDRGNPLGTAPLRPTVTGAPPGRLAACQWNGMRNCMNEPDWVILVCPRHAFPIPMRKFIEAIYTPHSKGGALRWLDTSHRRHCPPGLVPESPRLHVVYTSTHLHPPHTYGALATTHLHTRPPSESPTDPETITLTTYQTP